MGSGARPKRQRKVVVDYFVYFVVRVLLCVMQALPESACQLLAKGLAWGFCDVCHFRSQVVDDNLRHAFPAASARRRMQICRGMWQHLMLLAFEIGRANRKIHETNWRDYVSFDGARNLVACQLDGRPVVIVTGHFGNFEISGYVAGLLGLPNFTVARPLDNRFLHDFIGRFRHSTGQQIISSRGSADLVGKVLEAGASLAVLGDHYGGPKGCWIEFFHRPASCHKSIALLALSYEAPLIVFHTQRTGRMLHFKLVANPTGSIPVTPTAQNQSRRLRSGIRRSWSGPLPRVPNSTGGCTAAGKTLEPIFAGNAGKNASGLRSASTPPRKWQSSARPDHRMQRQRGSGPCMIKWADDASGPGARQSSAAAKPPRGQLSNPAPQRYASAVCGP